MCLPGFAVIKIRGKILIDFFFFSVGKKINSYLPTELFSVCLFQLSSEQVFYSPRMVCCSNVFVGFFSPSVSWNKLRLSLKNKTKIYLISVIIKYYQEGV